MTISTIRIAGRPDIAVPAGMDADQVLGYMGIVKSNYDSSVADGVLTLVAAAGTKGLIETIKTSEGTLLPKGFSHNFPTDADIIDIHSLFPEDNLFQTLNDPAKLQEYAKALVENKEKLDKEALSEIESMRRTEVERLVLIARALGKYATDVENPLAPTIVSNIADASDKLYGLLQLQQAALVRAAQIKEQREAEEKLVNDIVSDNKDLGELNKLYEK